MTEEEEVELAGALANLFLSDAIAGKIPPNVAMLAGLLIAARTGAMAVHVDDFECEKWISNAAAVIRMEYKEHSALMERIATTTRA